MSVTLYDRGAFTILAKYIQLKGNTWYFRRRVPDDVRSLHPGRKGQIFLSLKTADQREAAQKADRLARQQDALWKSFRDGAVSSGPELNKAALGMLAGFGLKPGQNEEYRRVGIEPDDFLNELAYLSDGGGAIIRENLPRHAELAAELFYGEKKPVPFLSEALDLFQRLKDEEEGSKLHAARRTGVGRFLDEAGNMPIDDYTRENARAFVEALVSDGKKSATIRRYINYVSPVFKLAIREYELNRPNIFDGIIIPKLGRDATTRLPFSAQELRQLQRACLDIDDDIRWLFALVSDTGARLAEVTGLERADVHLHDAIPHLIIQWSETRRVKSKQTQRTVPLVGASLWAAERALSETTGKHLFPRYASDTDFRATHASNALSKWIRSTGIDKTTHSLRHAMRDRLRNVGAPEEVQDRIGGWAMKSVGQGYGQGHSLEVLQGWLSKVVDQEVWSKGRT